MSKLPEVHTEMLKCTLCSELVKSRTQVVPGDGPETARIMAIGEAPGFHEDRQGIPFVGPAGQFLNDLFNSAGIKRNEVYITNVIKCRPLQNRDPLPIEVHNCQKWMDIQLEIVKPELIITLGRFSLTKFFPGDVISKAHGKARTRDNRVFFAMYHPAAALHQPALRHTIEQDMLQIPGLLAKREQASEEPKPQQLSMF